MLSLTSLPSLLRMAKTMESYCMVLHSFVFRRELYTNNNFQVYIYIHYTYTHTRTHVHTGCISRNNRYITRKKTNTAATNNNNSIQPSGNPLARNNRLWPIKRGENAYTTDAPYLYILYCRQRILQQCLRCIGDFIYILFDIYTPHPFDVQQTWLSLWFQNKKYEFLQRIFMYIYKYIM